jgi:hypothetical protein
MRRSAPLLASAGPPEENRHDVHGLEPPLSANRFWFRSVGGMLPWSQFEIWMETGRQLGTET